MPMFELVKEMLFVNTCVKFRHNRLRNEVYRAVTPLGHVRMNIRTYGQIPIYPVRVYKKTTGCLSAAKLKTALPPSQLVV